MHDLIIKLHAMVQKEYTNEEITVTWKPGVCQHSAKCWKGLIQVFNPSHRPWINMSGATTERIIEQVKKCPSGALGYYFNSENSTNFSDD